LRHINRDLLWPKQEMILPKLGTLDTKNDEVDHVICSKCSVVMKAISVLKDEEIIINIFKHYGGDKNEAI
jgi:hypothetical protein